MDAGGEVFTLPDFQDGNGKSCPHVPMACDPLDGFNHGSSKSNFSQPLPSAAGHECTRPRRECETANRKALQKSKLNHSSDPNLTPPCWHLRFYDCVKWQEASREDSPSDHQIDDVDVGDDASETTWRVAGVALRRCCAGLMVCILLFPSSGHRKDR